MEDEKLLLQKYKEIKEHGQGRITINIGPYSTDKTSILIEAGKTYKFIVTRYTERIID